MSLFHFFCFCCGFYARYSIHKSGVDLVNEKFTLRIEEEKLDFLKAKYNTDSTVSPCGTSQRYRLSFCARTELDHPLYVDFKNNATETLSRIVLEEISTENTFGMEEHMQVSGHGYTCVSKRVKPELKFSDFLGITDIEPEDGYPVLENVETMGEFASLFRADYDRMKPEGTDLNTFLKNYVSYGEYDHKAYHSVGDFFSGLLDITVIKPIIECITGTDLITGEDLTEGEKSMKLAGAVIDLFTFGQALALTKGAKLGAKMAGKVVAVELLSNTAAYAAGYAGNAMGLPLPATWMLSVLTGCSVSKVSGKYIYKDVDGLVHELTEEEVERLIKNQEIEINRVSYEELLNQRNVGSGGEGGAYVLPNAEDLKMSQTVQNHMNDVIKKGPNAGQLSRPYINSDGTTLLLKEIMESTVPVPDVVLQSGLRWDVSGAFRGSTGTWELVVDISTNTVVHFNFISQ